MKKIIHIDMDCFYAAVEVRDNPELQGYPVAVGGLSGNRGVICAANYEARKYGVRSALSSAIAVQKCPQLRLITPDIQKYAAESRKIHEIFRNFTDIIEPLSLDEAYLDVSGSEYFQGSASLIAREIRKQIYVKTGLTASAGIAENKFLAKVASDWNKPNGQFVITPDMVEGFMKKLPVEKIWGVGKVTAQKMHELNLRNCGDLQNISQKNLADIFGSFGYDLYNLCRGIDFREVITQRERKSLSIERTFSEDAAGLEECLELMPKLYDNFLKRLQGLSDDKKRQMRFANTLFVKIKFSDFTVTTVEKSFGAVNIECFYKLLKSGYERKNQPVRLIGLGVRFKSNKPLNADARQLLLF